MVVVIIKRLFIQHNLSFKVRISILQTSIVVLSIVDTYIRRLPTNRFQKADLPRSSDMTEIQLPTEPRNDEITNKRETDAAVPSELEVMGAKQELITLAAPDTASPEIKYPGLFLSSVLHAALLLAMFLVALDMVCASLHNSRVPVRAILIKYS